MTIPEAARLVLLAGSFGEGGDLFVLDMGQPVKIANLARQMIEAAGLTVRDNENAKGDIDILVTGLRPGEKLHEELMLGEAQVTPVHPKIMKADEEWLSEVEVASAIRSLVQAVEEHDDVKLRAILGKWASPKDNLLRSHDPVELDL